MQTKETKTIMKSIRTLSILVALMGVVHIIATFSPLIGGKLACIDTGTYWAMIYMSLMCGLLLIVLGWYVAWAIGKTAEHQILKRTTLIATTTLLVDGVLAVIFMSHNPFAWTIGVMCVAIFILNTIHNANK